MWSTFYQSKYKYSVAHPFFGLFCGFCSLCSWKHRQSYHESYRRRRHCVGWKRTWNPLVIDQILETLLLLCLFGHGTKSFLIPYYLLCKVSATIAVVVIAAASVVVLWPPEFTDHIHLQSGPGTTKECTLLADVQKLYYPSSADTPLTDNDVEEEQLKWLRIVFFTLPVILRCHWITETLQDYSWPRIRVRECHKSDCRLIGTRMGN